jgi:hypothetical protein
MTVRVRPNRVVEVDPWPFRGEEFEGRCEARILNRTFGDEMAMRQALDESEQRTLIFRFVQADNE